MRRSLSLAFGVLALLALAALVAGLQGAVFRAGRPLPAPSPLPEPPRMPRPEPMPYDWVFQLLRAFFLVSVVLLVLGIFFRDLRRHILRFLWTMAILVLVWYGLQRFLHFEEPEISAPAAVPSGSESFAGGPVDPGEGRPPGWSIYVGALALGALLAFWLTPKLLDRWERAHHARAIEEIAHEARRELIQGAPVNDVVMRCWLRMVEILSRRSGAQDSPPMTPREFAQTLARLGFRDEAISLLTQLFEEVRYGHKDSESRRDLALSALSALEKAYG